MSRSQFISPLLKLDARLAMKALKNDRLTSRLKVAALLEELAIRVQKQ